MTYLVANMAQDMGVLPSQLLKETPEMFQALLQVYEDRAKKAREARANRH